MVALFSVLLFGIEYVCGCSVLIVLLFGIEYVYGCSVLSVIVWY